MLTLLTDNFASDAAASRICQTVREKKKCILLVPEQETLSAEARYAALLPADAPLYFEVSNFSRLANRAFRTVGGICYRYADAAADILLMWKACEALTPFLSIRTAPSSGRLKELLAVRAELAAAGVGEKELRRAAASLTGEERLRNKLTDLSLLLHAFEGERKERFGDTAEDLSVLAKLLRENALFSDTLFFIDSFSSFTAPELFVLGELMRKTCVTVCLTLPEDAAAHLCYEETAHTLRTLCDMADKAGVSVRKEKAEEYPLPKDIAAARDFLFRADRRIPSLTAKNGDLSLIRIKDPTAAIEYIAAHIAKGVASGKRYGDYAIVAADSGKYEGIIDAALEEQGIPFFMSVHTDLLRFAAIKSLLLALRTVVGGYKREDVLSYLKCAHRAISDDAADRFALYAEFWRLRGKHFKDDTPFSLSPKGHTALSDKDKEALSSLHDTKKALLAPVWRLDAALQEAKTVTEHTTALYRYLRDVRWEEALAAEATAAEASGRRELSESLSRLPSVLYGLFDLMHELMGEEEISLARFAELLSLLLSVTPLGKLPATVDAVTVGNAETLRLHRPRTVFLFGVNEGEFPSAPAARGAFEENERRLLLSVGLPLESDPVERASRASFCFLRALTAPTEEVLLITFSQSAAADAQRPSEPFLRLERFFGPALSPKEEIWNKKAGTKSLHRLAGTPEGAALAFLLAKDEGFRRYADMGKEKICDSDCRVSKELASTVFPPALYTTQSRLDSYANCPFSYYSRYVLRFDEKKNADIGAKDIGSLVHGLLEEVFLRLEKDGKTIRTVSREALGGYVDTVCRDYLRKNFAEEVIAAPRTHRLFLRLRRAASLLIEDLHAEFADSDFTPVFFELPIGKDGGPDVLAFADEEGEVRLSGTIDRVDTYRDEKGDVYLRVIDYKTGKKEFSVENIGKGRDLQMFLYLCSLWKSKDKAFLSRLGVNEGNEIIPAGMLYTKAAVTGLKLSAFTSDEDAAALAKKEFTRSGLLLQDENILRAMDHSLSGHFFPVATDKKTGEIKWNEHFASLSRMGELLGEMESAVLAIVSDMRAGRASATPADKKDAGFVVCDSCSFKPFCRKEE